MRFEDFEYDGKQLSDLGYMVCEFSSNGINVIKGANINLNTVSNSYGTKNYLVNSKYDNVLEDTFQICKNTCNNDNMELDVNEQRALTRWLNRKNYHKFKYLTYDYLDFYFEATFNVSYIERGGKIYGLELEMVTNKPFALSKEKDYKLEILDSNQTIVLIDESDDEGCICPHMRITIGDIGGDFKISNTVGDKTDTMIIKNCTAGEEIVVDYPIIYSSVLSHKIQNDFNWKFFGISNTNNNRVNKITVSLPCTIEMGYSPSVKLGL